MSGRSEKPDSSVASTASARTGGAGQLGGEGAGQALAGDRRGALADDLDPA